MKRSASKPIRFSFLLCLAVWAAGPRATAQTPVIASFGGNGELVCTNLVPGSVAVVEWASSVLGPWTNNWEGLASVTADSNGMIRVRVPMFYRVRGEALPPVPEGMVWIPPGTFTMGSPDTEVDRDFNEGPQTTVTLTRGFYMSKYEVTQVEYQTLMGSNPSQFTGDATRPVEMVTWYDATNYCGQLTQRERAARRIGTNSVYRLPTEAEWEYACRAGTTTRFSYADGDDPGYGLLGNYAWYDDNSGSTTHPVGQMLPNPWGLEDVHGNVYEWCQDWYGSYPGGSVTDPQGPATGSDRVFRGGSWYGNAEGCRSANRSHDARGSRRYYLGFRLVLAPAQP